jgi:hypothetical protein
MEKQCSRVEWLCEGDHNTTFFQAKAKQRTSTNKIKVLKRPDGSICTRQEELESLAADFYQQLFSAQAHSTPEDVVHFVPHKVTPAMNTLLDAPFTAEEVKNALFIMKPNKAPGPDGFTAGFFQRHWQLIGNDVCAAVLTFLNGSDMTDIVNNTILVLIRKVKNP